ncbi:MAG: hypothetical protein K6G40_00560, partial [Eubacterium sp.]|nr:hypothetical protein [Eubacterium sp.]
MANIYKILNLNVNYFLSSAALAVATGFDSGSSVGVSYTGTATECVSVEEDDKKEKVWTITCIGADGISSKKCQNGKVL